MPPNDEKSEPRAAIGLFALKDNEEFLVADALGDIHGGGDGFFRRDTRVLSRFRLKIGDASPSLLSSGVSADNVFFRANVTNRPLPALGGRVTPHGVIHIERSRFLWSGRLHERLMLTNYGGLKVAAPLRFEFAADFADMFEVRGYRRVQRGRMQPAIHDPSTVASRSTSNSVLIVRRFPIAADFARRPRKPASPCEASDEAAHRCAVRADHSTYGPKNREAISLC